MVSPGNPLKDRTGMAPLADRVASAKQQARHPRILVTTIECDLGTRYTADTLSALRGRFPQTRFVWLMGADNLGQVHRWQRWETIFQTMPIAVFDRPPYRFYTLAAPAARRYGRQRVDASAARRLADLKAPAWCFFASRQNPLSATALRRAGGWLRLEQPLPILPDDVS
jgi:nicotinate-nucleotide adenylyltransferase